MAKKDFRSLGGEVRQILKYFLEKNQDVDINKV
jgi:hypothetical protein